MEFELKRCKSQKHIALQLHALGLICSIAVLLWQQCDWALNSHICLLVRKDAIELLGFCYGMGLKI